MNMNMLLTVMKVETVVFLIVYLFRNYVYKLFSFTLQRFETKRGDRLMLSRQKPMKTDFLIFL